MGKAYEGFHAQTKAGVELEWVTNSDQSEWLVRGDLIIGPPKPTDTQTSEELASSCFIGFYRIKR